MILNLQKDTAPRYNFFMDENRDKQRKEIRLYRAAHGLTQAQLAELIGVHPVTMSRYENMKGDIASVPFKKLQALLGEKRPQPALAVQQVTCPECKESVPIFHQGRRLWHCGMCGAPLGQLCQGCGEVNPNNARYCYQCGEPIIRNPRAPYPIPLPTVPAMAAEEPAPQK